MMQQCERTFEGCCSLLRNTSPSLSDESALSLWATSIGVEAFVTPLDLPGKSEAGGPGQRHLARPALSQNAAPLLQAAVVARTGRLR
jgi:hypothetical protein